MGQPENIVYVPMSIFDSHAEGLVNPVNALGVSGAGLALQFAERYPDACQRYKAACYSGVLTAGKVYVERTVLHPRKLIFFLATKDDWRGPSRLEWIESGLRDLVGKARLYDCKSIAVPAIGCGLGGLEWKDVRELIEKILGATDLDVTVTRKR